MRPSALTVLFILAAGSALAVSASAQTPYHDPQGRYDLQIPTGWQVVPDKEADQIVIRNGAVQAILSVQQQNKSNAMTTKEFVDSVAKEFQGQCPTTQSRKSGTVTLAGAAGIYQLFTCSDPRSPAVAEADSALTQDTVLIGFTVIAPLSRYYSSEALLDGIRDSLRLAGQKAVDAQPSSLAQVELEKACAVGALTQEQCARQLGILLGKDVPATPAVATTSAAPASQYRDPQGRFSLLVPPGWEATSEGDNGAAGVQLRSGNNWIDVMPAAGAPSASAVVLQREQKIATQSNSDRKPPFGSGGLIQLFGNGLEVTYDHFNGSSTDGAAVESYIAGVGGISGTGHAYLLLEASIQSSQSDPVQGGATFLATAQSVRLPAR